MIGQAVDVNTLRVLASTRQVREAVAGRWEEDRSQWKNWARLDTLVKFAENAGLKGGEF